MITQASSQTTIRQRKKDRVMELLEVYHRGLYVYHGSARGHDPQQYATSPCIHHHRRTH